MKNYKILTFAIMLMLTCASFAQHNISFKLSNPAEKLIPEKIILRPDTTEITFITPEAGFLHEPGSEFSFSILDTYSNKVFRLLGASVRFGVSIPADTRVRLYFEAINPETENISIYQGRFGMWNCRGIELLRDIKVTHNIRGISANNDLQEILNSITNNTLMYIDHDNFISENGFELKNKSNITLVFREDAKILCSTKYENVFNITECNNIRIINGHFLHLTYDDDICQGFVFHVFKSQNIEITKCDINGSGSVGVSAGKTSNLIVSDCHIHRNTHAAFYFMDNESGQIKLINNHIEKNGTTGNVVFSEWSYLPADSIKITSLVNHSVNQTDSIMRAYDKMLTEREINQTKLAVEADSIRTAKHFLNVFQNNTLRSDRWKSGVMLQFYNDFYILGNLSGDSWGRTYPDCKSVSFCPANNDIIYVIRQKNLVEKTVDGGKNWVVIHNGLENNQVFQRIINNPHNASELFLLTSNCIYRTTDAGFTWRFFAGAPNVSAFFIGRKNKQFFLVNSEIGMFYSENGGVEWKPMSANLPKILVKGTGRTAVYEPITPTNVAFADFDTHSLILIHSVHGSYKSTDLGSNWTKITDDFITSTYIGEKDIWLAGTKKYDGVQTLPESIIYNADHAAVNWKKILLPSFGSTGILTGIYQSEFIPGLILTNNQNRIMHLDQLSVIRGLNFGFLRHSVVKSEAITRVNGQDIVLKVISNNNYTDILRYGIFTSDNGITWKESLNYDDRDYSRGMRKMLVSPFNPQEVWCFDGDYNFITFNCGVTWYNLHKFYTSKEIYNNNISDFAFHYQNPNVVYFVSGVNDDFLYRYDRSTKGEIKLRLSGSHIKVSEENSDIICTSKLESTRDGGWTWFNFRVNLEKAVDNEDIFFNHATVIPESISPKKMIYRVIYKEKVYFFSSDDNGLSWNKI